MIYGTGNRIIPFYYMIKYCRKLTFTLIVLIDKYTGYMSNPIIHHHYNHPNLQWSKNKYHM